MKSLILFLIVLIFSGCRSIVGGYACYQYPIDSVDVKSCVLYLKSNNKFLLVSDTKKRSFYTHGEFKKNGEKLILQGDSIDYPFLQTYSINRKDTTIKFLYCAEIVQAFSLYKDGVFYNQVDDKGEIHIKDMNMQRLTYKMGDSDTFPLLITDKRNNYFIINHTNDGCQFYNNGILYLKLYKDTVFADIQIDSENIRTRLKLKKEKYLNQ